MQALQGRPRWRLVSQDDAFLEGDYVVLQHLKRHFLSHVLTRPEPPYSPAFTLAGLHMAVMYLHDRVEAARKTGAGFVLVDSYYYKIWAKCVLKGLVDRRVFSLWRALPKPDRVFLLHAEPEVLWERSGEGALLNPFEYHGPRPERGAFLRFQEEMTRLMVREAGGCPLEVLEARGSTAEISNAVAHHLEAEA